MSSYWTNWMKHLDNQESNRLTTYWTKGPIRPLSSPIGGRPKIHKHLDKVQVVTRKELIP